MKSFFLTLLIIVSAFLAYDYFLAPPGDKMVFKDLNPPKKPKVVKEPAARPVEAETPKAPKPEEVTTRMLANAPAPAVAVPAAPKPDSIEALTKNWQVVSPSAFPREVTLLKDVQFKMAAGTSKMAAGRKVQALALTAGTLTLAPAVGSTARANVALDDTDLKAVLTDIYEKWKVARAAYLQDVAAKKRQNTPSVSVAPNPNAAEADAAGKPTRSSDGSYPLLLASMRRGQVTEIKPENISSMGEPQPTKVQGKDGWAIVVGFEAKTVFGPQPTEAQAIIVNGQVQGWFFTGSGEEVP